MMQHEHYLMDAVQLALKAGEAILEVYGADFDIWTKADDSPLTLADRRSHGIIASAETRVASSRVCW